MSGILAPQNDLKQTVDFIMSQLDENGVKVDRVAVEKKVQDMAAFFVPLDEAKHSVTDAFLKRHGIKARSKRAPSSPSKPVKIAEIKEEGKWVSVIGRVCQIWETNSESIMQKGLIEDETGRIAFTIFTKSNLQPLELDACYYLKNVVSDSYNDRISLKLNKTSLIEEVDVEMVPSTPAKLEGAIVAILPNSGIIKRCPECKRILERGDCSKHGRQNSAVQDLQIKAVLDNGREMYTLVVGCSTTEKVIGMTMAEATRLVMETLDAESVRDVIKQKLLGRNFLVEGKLNMGYVLPVKFTPVEVTAESVMELVKRVEAV